MEPNELGRALKTTDSYIYATCDIVSLDTVEGGEED